MRARRTRYIASGDVLSAQRFGFVARTESDRGRPRFLCRSNKAKLYRPRRFAANETKRPARKARSVSDEGERTAAAAALFRFRKRRAHRRSDQRHAFSELELGRRHGVCLGTAREDRRPDRHRNSRKEISRHHRKETALQKIMNVPDDLLYTETHEWIKREGENVRIGVTDHAQSELTDVVYIELPKMDQQANAKEAIAVVESVKAASDIYAPVKGKVVEVNKALEADPGLINREPFGQGWIFVLKIDSADDLKNLKDAAAYKKQIG